MTDNWGEIKRDYLNGMSTYEISEKYEISESVIYKKADKEDWKKQREELCDEHDARSRRILDLSDRVLDKVDSALNEIGSCIIRKKEKNKTVEYDDELKKPVSETVTESESVEIANSMIDTSALKQIVSTLKDVKDIHLGFTDNGQSSDEKLESGIIMISQIEKKLSEGSDDN